VIKLTSMKSFGISGIALLAIFIASVSLFFYAPLRNSVRDIFALPERKILSVATGYVIPDTNVRVAKVLTRDGLYLEIYGPAENGFEPLIDRIKLPDRRDAFMQFQGRATNLAIQDMNGDRHFEIIAPSYDESFVPHLNIYHYNPAIGRFEPYEKP
jgi:hypothetical protein